MEPNRVPEAELGNLALDFLYTLRGTRRGVVDLLSTPRDLLEWLDRCDEAGANRRLEGRVSVPEARSLFDEALRLRTDIGALVVARATRAQTPALALYGLNRTLAAGRWLWRLTPEPSGSIVLTAHEADTAPLAHLGPIALAAARLVTTVDASRLRHCAAPGCGAWFLDTSKGGRRRWCSMARCGNREKAATHRGKRRAS